ncbi:hypothetical protein [Streptomyces sp. NPDC048551]|uniref:hypothetical protein n=1 Tax=Streptomyces sp. NPDC048551 TaxID=3155758 RepID=UPI00344A7874
MADNVADLQRQARELREIAKSLEEKDYAANKEQIHRLEKRAAQYDRWALNEQADKMGIHPPSNPTSVASQVARETAEMERRMRE